VERNSGTFHRFADKDLWGEQHGVLHGHGTPFNKVWAMPTHPAPLDLHPHSSPKNLLARSDSVIVLTHSIPSNAKPSITV